MAKLPNEPQNPHSARLKRLTKYIDQVDPGSLEGEQTEVAGKIFELLMEGLSSDTVTADYDERMSAALDKAERVFPEALEEKEEGNE